MICFFFLLSSPLYLISVSLYILSFFMPLFVFKFFFYFLSLGYLMFFFLISFIVFFFHYTSYSLFSLLHFRIRFSLFRSGFNILFFPFISSRFDGSIFSFLNVSVSHLSLFTMSFRFPFFYIFIGSLF